MARADSGFVPSALCPVKSCSVVRAGMVCAIIQDAGSNNTLNMAAIVKPAQRISNFRPTQQVRPGGGLAVAATTSLVFACVAYSERSGLELPACRVFAG